VANGASLVVAFFVTVAAAIAHLVSTEVLGTMPPVTRSFAIVRIVPVVAVLRVVVIIDVAMEVFRAVKPWTGADKDPIGKPLGAVITVGSATVRRGIEVAIGTNGRYTDADADLGMCSGSTCCDGETSDGGQSEKFHSTHRFTSLKLEKNRGGEVALQIIDPVGCYPEKVA
jgi:hypothetical protein